MYLATITRTGDGTAPVVNLTFPYISPDDIVVYVDGVAVAYHYTGSSTITLDQAVAAGSTIVVRRQTPRNLLVDFTDGSTLTETDLDLLATQLIYRTEEAADAIEALGYRLDAEDVVLDTKIDDTDAALNARIDATVADFNAQLDASGATFDQKLAVVTAATEGTVKFSDGVGQVLNRDAFRDKFMGVSPTGSIIPVDGAPMQDALFQSALSAADGMDLIGTPRGPLGKAPQRLTYGKRQPLTTVRQAVQAIPNIPSEIVGFAAVAGTTGGDGYPYLYVNHSSLDPSIPHSFGWALAKWRAAGGAVIYFDPRYAQFDVVFHEQYAMDDISNLTVYAPGRNVTFWGTRLGGVFHIMAQNIIFKNIEFRPLAGPINGSSIGEGDVAQSIIDIRSDYADKLAFINVELRHPSWHSLDLSNQPVPPGTHQCRVTVQNSIFWDAIQNHLIGTPNGSLDPADYTNDDSERVTFVTLYRNIYAYSLQRNPKVLGQAQVDMVGCAVMLQGYPVEYLDDETTTYPDVHASGYGADVQEGGWLSVRGTLMFASHSTGVGLEGTMLTVGYSGNTGRIAVTDSAFEDAITFVERDPELIAALPYTLDDAVPAEGPLREAWYADLWADAGARVDAAPEGLFQWVPGSTELPNGDLTVSQRGLRDAGMWERVDIASGPKQPDNNSSKGGAYTPVLKGILTNVGSVTFSEAAWTRLENGYIAVEGQLVLSAGGSGNDVQFGISLPTASALGDTTEVFGSATAYGLGTNGGAIIGHPAASGGWAYARVNAAGLAATTYSYRFTYKVNV